jgi:hypothetical protein
MFVFADVLAHWLIQSHRSFEGCDSLSQYQNIGAASKCTPEKGLLEEPYSTKDSVNIPVLPGCNPICSSRWKYLSAPFELIENIFLLIQGATAPSRSVTRPSHRYQCLQTCKGPLAHL